MFQTVLKDAGAWLVFAICGVISVVFYDDVKGGMAHALGIDLTALERQTTTAQQAAASWAATGKVAASPETADNAPSGGVELRAGSHGHFEARAEINGKPVDVMVDTGASLVALSYEDAQRAGIYVKDSDFTQRTQTANGIARAAPVILERVSIGDITIRNVRASVAERGRQNVTLLGMTFLSRLSRTEMRKGTLVLYE
jgi:aspartyl protease family protein